MTFQQGQGILGKIRFKDGKYPSYNRTYLIVGVYSDYIEVLNVSSTQGKEHKLLFKANRKIINHYPPFTKPSFVKLDSLVKVPLKDCQNLIILAKGQTLDKNELQDIIKNTIKP